MRNTVRFAYTNALGTTWTLYQDVFDPYDQPCEIVEFLHSSMEPTDMFAKVAYPDNRSRQKIFNVISLRAAS